MCIFYVEYCYLFLCRTSGLEVLKIGEEKTRLKSSAELAAEFRNKRLYGSGIPRETSKYCLYHNHSVAMPHDHIFTFSKKAFHESLDFCNLS